MKLERAILLAFFANYLVNNVVAAVVALIPPSATPGVFTPQYTSFVVLSALLVAVFAWWYMKKGADIRMGVIFGVTGFLVAVLTALISGLAGVVLQTGSLAQIVSVLPNFWPFLYNWSTLVLLGYWVIPAVAIGWWLGRSSSMATNVSKPIF